MPKHNEYISLLNANLDKKFVQRTLNPYGKRLLKTYKVNGKTMTKPQSIVTEERDGILYPTVQEVRNNSLLRLKTKSKTRLKQFSSDEAMDRAISNNNYIKVPKKFYQKGMNFGDFLSNSSYVNKIRNR